MGYETKMFVVTTSSNVKMPGSMFINDENNEPKYVFKGDKQNYFTYNNDKTQHELTKQEEKEIFKAHVCMTIAMVDLCKCNGLVGALISKSHKEETVSRGIMFNTTDGNRYISLDQYNDPMYLISSEEVLEVIKKEHESSAYRRYDMAIRLLESILLNFDTANQPTYIMFYGY